MALTSCRHGYLKSWFHEYRNRKLYFAATTVWLLLSWHWAFLAQAYVLANRATIGNYVMNNLGFTVASAAITLLWSAAAWQRIYSLGVSTWTTTFCASALLALWTWVITAPTHKLTAYALFALTQLPLLVLPKRGDRTGQ
jgi:hypothetical protein